MATKKLVAQLTKDWLSFSPRQKTNEEVESLGRAYFQAFKSYKDQEIIEAAEKYAESGDYFPPKPIQITMLVKDAKKKKHDRELVEMWTCKRCHQKVSSMTSEGVCLDCSGVPIPTYEHIKPWRNEKRIHYKIEGRIKCQQCGIVGECIREPSEDGQWLCKDCYSGLTSKERKQRLNDLARMVEDGNYKPEWVKLLEELPF